MVNTSETHTNILWQKVWSVAVLLAAIMFSWIIYGHYQPKLLQSLGFVELAIWLGVWQGLLGVFIEPVIGHFSDHIMQQVGSRLPVIAFGITSAGLIFVIVAWLLNNNLPAYLYWLVPVLMTVWMVAMLIFRGPAIALIAQLAPLSRLPEANVVLTFVFGCVGAISPLVTALLDQGSAPVAFVAGAIALLIGAFWLWRSAPPYIVNPAKAEDLRQTPRVLLSLDFAVGLSASFTINFMLAVVPIAMKQQIPTLTSEVISSSILLIGALASLPLGKVIEKWGVKHSMLVGLFLITLAICLIKIQLALWLSLGLIVLAGLGFSFVFVAMIPFALSVVVPNQAGLGTGLYFSGASGATAVFVGLGQLFPNFLDYATLGAAIAFSCSLAGMLAIAKLQLHYSNR